MDEHEFKMSLLSLYAWNEIDDPIQINKWIAVGITLYLHDVLRQQENGATKLSCNTDYVCSIQLLFFSYHCSKKRNPLLSSVLYSKLIRSKSFSCSIVNENIAKRILPLSPLVTRFQLTTLGSTALRSSRKKIPFDRLLSCREIPAFRIPHIIMFRIMIASIMWDENRFSLFEP